MGRPTARPDTGQASQPQGTRGEGMVGQEYRRAAGRPWSLPPLEMLEEVSPHESYQEFVRKYNAHVNAVNAWVKEELDRIWDALSGWGQD